MMKTAIFVGLAFATCVVGAAPAKRTARRVVAAPQPAVAALPETAFRRTPYVGAIAVDAQTGKVLFERNADMVARPKKY